MKVALNEYQEHRANLTNSMSIGPVNGRIMWFILHIYVKQWQISRVYICRINQYFLPTKLNTKTPNRHVVILSCMCCFILFIWLYYSFNFIISRFPVYNSKGELIWKRQLNRIPILSVIIYRQGMKLYCRLTYSYTMSPSNVIESTWHIHQKKGTCSFAVKS